MADFDSHIEQAKKNLSFLGDVSHSHPEHFDWQVTIAYYTAVHLVDAHLAKYGLTYRKHFDVKNALNPNNAMSPCRLQEGEYLAYVALENLSRRARYLTDPKQAGKGDPGTHFTYDKHVGKAVRHLNTIIEHFSALYKIDIPACRINCTGIKQGELSHFELVS